MADENIGGVSISVSGDFSDLDAQFAQAVQIAESQGKTLADAMSSAFSAGAGSVQEALSQIIGSFEGAGNAVDTLAGQLDQARTAAQNYAGSAEAIMQAQKDADEELATAQKALADIQGMYDAGSASANDLARGAQAVQSAFDKANPALKEAGESAETASGGFASMATSILALGGITLSIEALVDLGKTAIDASDKLDDAAYAIGRLNQGAMAGKEEIAGLLAVAQDEGLSFPNLVTAAQHIEVLGVHGQDAIDTLEKLGNAAELTGGSIDSMAQKFATLAEGTSASAMSLKRIGLTVDEVKQSMIDMGANADLVNGHWKELWKTMDETQHADVLRAALSSLDGAAKAMNDDIKGDVQRSLNEFYVSIAKLGDVIGPLAQQVLPYLIDGLKVLATGIDVGITSVKVLIDVFGTWLGVLKDVYSGLGEAANALQHLDFSGAATAVSAAIDRVKADMADMSTKIQTDVKAGADFAKQAWGIDVPDALGKTSGAAKDTSGELSGLTVTTKESKEAAKEYAQELSGLNTELGKIGTVLGSVSDSYDQYLQSLQDGGKAAVQQLKDIDAAIEAASKEALKLKDPAMIEGLQEWISKLKEARDTVKEFAEEDAWNKLAGQIAGLAAKFPQQIGEMTGALKDFVQQALNTAEEVPAAFNKVDPAGLIAKWLEAQKQLDDQTQKMGDHFQQAMNKFHESVRNEAIPITVTLEQRLAALDQDFKDINGVTFTQLAADLHGLGITFDGLTDKENEAKNALIDIANIGSTTLPEIEQAWAKVSGVIDKLAKTDLPAAEAAWQAVLDKMIAANAPIGDILAIQAKMAQGYIDAAAKAGIGANDSVIALDLIKQHVKDLHDGIQNLGGNLFTDILKSWNDAFDKMGKSIADNIVAGKSWADTWHTFVKQIETEILESLIGTAFKALRSELDTLLGSLFPSLQGAITGTGGAIGGLAGAAKTAAGSVASVGEAATDAFPSISKAGGAAGGLASGASSAAGSLVSMVGAIGSVIGALAGIAGDILQAHANNLLGEIEINTRSAFNEISNARADAWSQYNGLFDRLGDIWGTLQSLGAAGTGQSEGMKNELDALSNIGQTLLDIDTNIYNVLTTLQGGIGTSGKSTGTQDLSGQSLSALNAAVTALNGIWGDENLIVQGIQNLAIDIQALGNQSAQGAADFKNLFTNAQTTTAGQIATITKQISDNNAQIALALASNNNTLAKSLGEQNATLQAQLAALQDLQKYGSAAAASAAEARDAAIKQLAAAQTVAERIAALQAEAKADAALAIEEQRLGNQSAADAANKAAADIMSQIAALMGPLNDIDANTSGLAAALANSRGSGSPSQEATPVAGTTESGRGGASGTGTTSSTPPPSRGRAFAAGGFVDETQMALVHQGEFVIPEDVTGMLRKMAMPGGPMNNYMNVGGNSSSTQSSSDTYQFIIQAGNRDGQALLREISSAVKTRTGRTAKFSN